MSETGSRLTNYQKTREHILANKQTDRQADRQTDRQTDKQTPAAAKPGPVADTHTLIYLPGFLV